MRSFKEFLLVEENRKKPEVRDQKTLDKELFVAVRVDDVEETNRALSHGADPNARNNGGGGWTPLHFAAQSNHGECLKALLEAGADPEARERHHHQTPLHLAASNGATTCVRALLRKGADPNARDDRGRTPLHRAAWFCRTACAKLLLKGGADPNAKSLDGQTPLHNYGPWSANTACVELLLRSGTDPFARDAKGNTPLDLADSDRPRKALRDAMHAKMTATTLPEES